MVNNDLYLVDRKTQRRRSAITVLLCLIAWGLFEYALPASRPDPEPEVTHITVPAKLFRLAEGVCMKNDGFDEIIIKRTSDKFLFKCLDGMMTPETTVRIAPKVSP